MRSFLVVRNGKLVVEEYFERENDPRPQQIKSITKSITSLLIGIAIDKQFITSESVEIKPYFPEYFSTHHDSRKEKITIEQLLTMRSGINFADTAKYSKYENTKSWDEPGAYRAYWRTDNALDLALNYDMVESDDQEIILYSTPAIDLLSTVLERSTGMTTKEFADENLFGPLGITNYTWAHDSAFHYIGGFTIFIRPRSLARVGQLLLQDGKFNNQQIVSKSWIDQSSTVAIPDFVTMETLPATFDYGYLWYLGKFKGFDVKFAWGWGGQFLVLIPEANTLIVTTAWPDPDGVTHWNKSQEIWKKIISNVIESL